MTADHGLIGSAQQRCSCNAAHVMPLALVQHRSSAGARMYLVLHVVHLLKMEGL